MLTEEIEIGDVIPYSQSPLSALTTMPPSPSNLASIPSNCSHHQSIQPSDNDSSQHLSSEAHHAGAFLTSVSLPSKEGRTSGPFSSMLRITTPRIVTLPLNLSCTPPFNTPQLHDTAIADNSAVCLTTTSPLHNSLSLHQNSTDPATMTGTVTTPDIPPTFLNSTSPPPQSICPVYGNDTHSLHNAVHNSASPYSAQSLRYRVKSPDARSMHGVIAAHNTRSLQETANQLTFPSQNSASPSLQQMPKTSRPVQLSTIPCISLNSNFIDHGTHSLQRTSTPLDLHALPHSVSSPSNSLTIGKQLVS